MSDCSSDIRIELHQVGVFCLFFVVLVFLLNLPILSGMGAVAPWILQPMRKAKARRGLEPGPQSSGMRARPCLPRSKGKASF